MPNFAKEVCKNAEAVSRAAAQKIVARANACAQKNGRFTIALSGGSTPKAAYALMAAEPLLKQMPWDKTHIYFGD